MDEMRFDAFGTDCHVQAYGQVAPSLLEAVRSRALELHHLMNAFDETSDVARVSARAGEWVEVAPDVMAVLVCAQDVFRLTDGAFDVTCRPLSRLWEGCRKEGRIPSEDEVSQARDHMGWEVVGLDPARDAVRVPAGFSLDLGGIAKGYAADELCRILRAGRVESAIVDLGGSVSLVGARLDGSDFSVGIQNPLAPRGEVAARVPAHDGCVVTSGVNERFVVRDGRVLSHVIDPRTGWPAEAGLLSVSVCGTDAAVSDALATAIIVAGAGQGMAWLHAHGAGAVLVTTGGEVLATEGLECHT